MKRERDREEGEKGRRKEARGMNRYMRELREEGLG